MVARLALGLGLVAILSLALAGPAHQLTLLSLDAAFTWVRWGAMAGAIAVLAGAASVLCAGTAWVRGPLSARAAVLLGLAAVATGTTAVAVPVRWMLHVASVPAIVDVTTDLEHPPEFKTLATARAEGDNGFERDAEMAAAQRAAYPDIQPLVVPVSTDMAFEEVLEAMNDLEWQVVDASDTEGRVEVTRTSPWFGFKDDLVVRLTPVRDGTRVDVRGAARTGLTDGGRNAGHIRELFQELQVGR